MDLKKLILEKLNDKDFIKTADIVKDTGFSRVYVNRFLQELREEGSIILIGKANQARYVKADKESVLRERKKILKTEKDFVNENLSEDLVFGEIKRQTGIFLDLDKNLFNIINYAFTEMLNNAIDHSESASIKTSMERNGFIKFSVVDNGIGIFNNIMQKRNLKSEVEAVEDLLKGKQTTAPEKHSGEGIFFTSKIADNFIIESSDKRLVFNNKLEDIFIEDIKSMKGTKVVFVIASDSKKKLDDIFKEYADDSFEFNKTRVAVRLYKMGDIYISRSQARRVMNSLNDFEHIVLDFKHIKTVGQAFADEIFRVWQNNNSEITIETENINENINFMIQRAKGNK